MKHDFLALNRQKFRILLGFLFGSVLFLTPAFLFASDFSIVNIHEHIQSLKDAKRTLPIMDEMGISKMILLGSPQQTFFPHMIKNQRFDKPDSNNRVILFAAKRYPDRFLAFCVFHQEDKKILQKLKQCLKRGATGVKLFSGHGSFYTIPLNDPSLDEFYRFLEEKRIPILWHVNTGKYLEEFEAVLQAHPKLRVICGHFCLASKSRNRLRALLENYPNLYFDTSFGSPAVLADGIQTITEARDEFHEIFMKYPERFFWGTDYVITKVKTASGIRQNIRQNRAILEDILQLPHDILKKIYEENWQTFWQ